MRVDEVTSMTSMTSDMSEFDSADLFGSTSMSDVRLLEEKTRWRTRVIDLCKDRERPLNVAIIGPPGVGKSSLVNTIGAAFSDETWREYAYSGFHGDGSQVTVFTKSFPKCCHGNNEKYSDIKLPTLVDIAGFSDECGEKFVELLRIVFYGRLPEGESLAEADEYAGKYGLDGLRKKYSANNENLKIDRVIIVSSATEILPLKLIKCVIEAARPSGLAESHKRTIPMFGVLTKQDRIGSVQISKEDYKAREDQFINAVGLKGSEHRLMRCRNYCDDVDHGRRIESVIPELDIPALKFMSQVADPVFEVQNKDESYTKPEEEILYERQEEEPATRFRRRQNSPMAPNTTTEPHTRVTARVTRPGASQDLVLNRNQGLIIRICVEAALLFVVLQVFMKPPVDMGKLRGYCNYVMRSGHVDNEIESICSSMENRIFKNIASILIVVFYFIIRLAVKFVYEKINRHRTR